MKIVVIGGTDLIGSKTAGDWLRCAAVASSVLWLREFSKMVTRLTVNNQL
ncbi:MAG TPA: hypothetical protein VFH31_20990 [Pyrinomonadaceae bacterium]|nr:hypothetical protein [Pyrinomonadaceae bacterium]